jgi:hypothetical protein
LSGPSQLEQLASLPSSQLFGITFILAMTEVLSPHPQLRRILHKDHDEVVRNHALLSVKLTEMVCDFFQRLAQAEEAYIQQLLTTLKQFRRRTTELKKDRYVLLHLVQ